MSRKIATPAAVFEACDQLDASDKPWNREDVRLAVGGGGYSVIDPLIQAWRKLKPVKALASSTPTTLLHQVAETLELHFSQYIGDIEHREIERTRIFESSISDISERMSSVDAELEQAKASNLGLTQDCSGLRDTIEDGRNNLEKKERALLKLQAENDELRGLILRLEKQSDAAVKQHELDVKVQEQRYESNTSSMLKAHKLELLKEKKELSERNTQAENRLMLLLDKERTEAKKLISESLKERDLVRQKEQDSKEQAIKFKIENKALQDKVNALLLDKEKQNTSMAKADSRYKALHQEFQSFQKHNESIKFDELRATVLALQEDLKPKQND